MGFNAVMCIYIYTLFMDHKGSSSTTMVTLSPSKANGCFSSASDAQGLSTTKFFLQPVSNESDAVRGKSNGFKLKKPTLKHTRADLSLIAAVDDCWTPLSLDPSVRLTMPAEIKVHIYWNHTPKRSFCNVFLILQPFESIPSGCPFLQYLFLIMQLIFTSSQNVT